MEILIWKRSGLCGLILLVTACAPAPAEVQDVRYSGPVYFMKSTLLLTQYQCQELCKEDGSGCAGWRYEKPSEEEPLATCALLEIIAEETSDPCCISGKSSQAND